MPNATDVVCAVNSDLEGLLRPIGELHPDPRNARVHPARNLDAIRTSLAGYKQQKPVVVNATGKIIAGNGMFEAAKALGWTHVAAVTFDGTPEEEAAYGLADNKSADLSTFDDAVVASLMRDLKDADYDLLSTGFDATEIEKLLFEHPTPEEAAERAGQCDPDDVPPVPETPVSKLGDLWLMGDHKVLCGDSTKSEDVDRLMNGHRVSCVFCDPPYGVSIGAKNRLLNSVQKAGRCLEDIADDSLSPEELKAQLLPAFTLLRTNVMAEDCTLFVSAPQGGGLGMMMMMMMMMIEAGLETRHVLIWKKNQPTFSLGRLDYDYQHEPILLTWGAKHKRPMAGRHRTSVWEIDRERKCADHPTMKPVELYINAYQNNSDLGDNVADIYGGSGTAAIAAEQTRRKAFLLEISPAYVDVIVNRWQKFTGREARLESGETFAEVKAARAVSV